MTWEGLSPPYATIVADPPWEYGGGWGTRWRTIGAKKPRTRLAYSSMSVDQIASLSVADLAAANSHLYLWTTNRYLRDAFNVVEAWGFKPVQVLVWCKPPKGIGPGWLFAHSTEFVLLARRGSFKVERRLEKNWWVWSRGPHSAKPSAFLDEVEKVSPGPYVELFARQPRLGWDSWGWGYEQAAG